MGRRRKAEDAAFGNLSFMDVLANSIGAITFIFLMFFIVISGLVTPHEFKVLTDSLPDAREKTDYKVALAASGGTEPHSWDLADGRLPKNVRLNADTGVIEGAPAKKGTYRFTIKVTDATEGEKQAIKRDLILRVREPADRLLIGGMPLEIATGQMTPASVGTHYDITLSATGGDEPYSWSVVDHLPPGLALQGDRVIGAPQASGDWRFTVRVTDGIQANYDKTFPLYVRPRTLLTEDALQPFDITSKDLPNGVFKEEYTMALAAYGGVPPYTWSIEQGELPAGLVLDPDTGVITGKPGRVEKASFAITAKDSQRRQAFATRRMNIKIDPIFFHATGQNPLLTWWVLAIIMALVIVGIAVMSAMLIGVQCPWDHSWRCKSVGKDQNGRTIYACKHGHTFVNEPRLLSASRDAEEAPS